MTGYLTLSNFNQLSRPHLFKKSFVCRLHLDKLDAPLVGLDMAAETEMLCTDRLITAAYSTNGLLLNKTVRWLETGEISSFNSNQVGVRWGRVTKQLSSEAE